ncbi:hypothetical protein [Arthrobacter sp. NEB 688]|uniref:DUF7668 domain-containing protein n=1 Tax=Arthrobacter sp. NEB 688 TaxID=904039 RepID=UPI001563E993|nr:hypothetical protein [Arthrobacter sp. NEB 688]QKE84647.1 hypothetical protein HL663_12335 [Arthrobacter sp. NEB 688]
MPAAWRPALGEIVDQLVRGDGSQGRHIKRLEPVSDVVWSQCRDALEDYGDVDFISLPATSWETSVCQRRGERWFCHIDLWTTQEGRSDLVLEVSVREEVDGPRFTVELAYVP